MNSLEIFDQIYQDRIAVEPPDGLHMVAKFLWSKTVDSILKLPLKMDVATFPTLQQDDELKSLADEFNRQTERQIEFYKKLLNDFIQ